MPTETVRRPPAPTCRRTRREESQQQPDTCGGTGQCGSHWELLLGPLTSAGRNNKIVQQIPGGGPAQFGRPFSFIRTHSRETYSRERNLQRAACYLRLADVLAEAVRYSTSSNT